MEHGSRTTWTSFFLTTSDLGATAPVFTCGCHDFVLCLPITPMCAVKDFCKVSKTATCVRHYCCLLLDRRVATTKTRLCVVSTLRNYLSVTASLCIIRSRYLLRMHAHQNRNSLNSSLEDDIVHNLRHYLITAY